MLHTPRYSSCVSVIVAVMNGSYWPTSGADMAVRTLGYAEIGPGPISSRAGGAIGPGRFVGPGEEVLLIRIPFR